MRQFLQVHVVLPVRPCHVHIHQPESAGRLLSAASPIGSEEPAHKAIMISLDENTTPAPGRISRGTVPTFLSRTVPCRGHELGVHPFGRSLAGGHIVCRAFCRLRHSVSLGTRHRQPSSVSNLTRADEHEPSIHPQANRGAEVQRKQADVLVKDTCWTACTPLSSKVLSKSSVWHCRS